VRLSILHWIRQKIEMVCGGMVECNNTRQQQMNTSTTTTTEFKNTVGSHPLYYSGRHLPLFAQTTPTTPTTQTTPTADEVAHCAINIMLNWPLFAPTTPTTPTTPTADEIAHCAINIMLNWPQILTTSEED
jgi:hypothetical protein